MLSAWKAGLSESSWRLAAAVLLPVLVLMVLRWVHARRQLNGATGVPALLPRRLEQAVVVIALGLGFHGVFAQQALFDDAYISLRYARNLADGHGLVWNVGEAVEGYTNFLWTLLIGLTIKVTNIEAPLIALVFSWACFAGNLLVAWRLERHLASAVGLPRLLPVAPLCLALLPLFTAYGSTGMETGLCALLVSLGVWALVQPWSHRTAALAGAAFIAATLTRPDHALFYAIGSGVVVLEEARRWRASQPTDQPTDFRAALTRCLSYAAPFTLYAIYLAWKVSFYGELLPNTYYAKSADLTWYVQGRIYLTTFLLGSNAWIPLLLALVAGSRTWGLPDETGALSRARNFTVVALPLYCVYVVRVGGDFMYGRFFVPLLPLLFVWAGLALRSLLPRSGLAAPLASWAPWAVSAGLLLASVQPTHIPKDKDQLFGIVTESNYYPVEQLRPQVKVGHVHHLIGTLLRDKVVARGLSPVLGTGGIGMVGFYSGLPLVDVRGLTDPVVARQELKRRNRPGHEKRAPRQHLRERGVHFLRSKAGQRGFHPKRFRELTELRFEHHRDPWQLAHYDAELMAAVAAGVPEIRFRRFEPWLDRYIKALPSKSRSQVREDLRWFRAYYFEHNEDPERLSALVQGVGGIGKTEPSETQGTKAGGPN